MGINSTAVIPRSAARAISKHEMFLDGPRCWLIHAESFGMDFIDDQVRPIVSLEFIGLEISAILIRGQTIRIRSGRSHFWMRL